MVHLHGGYESGTAKVSAHCLLVKDQADHQLHLGSSDPGSVGLSSVPSGHYRELLADSQTTSSDQPLLTVTKGNRETIVTTDLLAKSLTVMLVSHQLDSSVYTLHGLSRGGGTAAYRPGIDQLDIKRHGLWASYAFRGYITTRNVANSPITAALAGATAAIMLTWPHFL